MKLGDRLVGEARERQRLRMVASERTVAGILAGSFLLAASAIVVLVPFERSADPLVLIALVVLYAFVSRVEFEVGSGYATPDQLVFVPMLFIAPLPLVPLMVAAGFLVASLPHYLSGETHTDRWRHALGDSWFSIGPVLVLAALAPGAPTIDMAGIYVLAFLAQAAVGLGSALVGEGLGGHLAVVDTLRSSAWAYRIDAVLAPVALMVAIPAYEEPLAIVTVGPLVWLLAVFSRERRDRYAAALELNSAYRGTVMLLADVVEADDNYTAAHCRSVVELVTAVADELEIDRDARQELEFAALLHDVGKISMPKEILNKPAALTDEEFEVVKRHPIEGQVLLDRVGGLLARVGATVRSCHERWDGGGYPDGLAGREIPWASRIVFCCDAYNAMTTNRPYRRAMSQETALEELWNGAGDQFDPQVVAALANVVRLGCVPAGPPVSATAVRSVLATGSLAARLEAAG